jgi:UDP-glucose 4-epimerase
MAIGRVKETTLQVFGNDYPTPYASFFFPLLTQPSPHFFLLPPMNIKLSRAFCRDGTCVRDYLHVLDLASGHLLALDALAPGSNTFDNCPSSALFKAYNLGRGQGFSVLQILEAMRAATGFDYRYNVIGRRCVASTVLLKKPG